MIGLDTDINQLPGIGVARASALHTMGIFTVRDLIYYFPRTYSDRTNLSLLSDSIQNTPIALRLTVCTVPTVTYLPKKKSIVKFSCRDASGFAEIVFFNQPYLKSIFTVGAEFRFWGRLTQGKKSLQLLSPDFEPILPGEVLPNYISKYSCGRGVSEKKLAQWIDHSLKQCAKQISEILPPYIMQKHNWMPLADALQTLHTPRDAASLQKATERMIYEELFLLALALHRMKQNRSTQSGVLCKMPDLQAVKQTLPFALTASQECAIRDILFDMTNQNQKEPFLPMTRMLAGDVGSGKTVCAEFAALCAVQSGYQVAFMAPTEVLARQHYQSLCSFFAPFSVSCALLVGSTPPKEKNALYRACASEDLTRPAIVVGTHALLNERVRFQNLGLIITDEQHRFGVNQRAMLKEKNRSAHLLVMSATPIPRSLALSLYGDLDISRITELPKGRQTIDTFVVDHSYRERIHRFIRKNVNEGGQVYIVCPAIEEAETFPMLLNSDDAAHTTNNVTSAVEYYEELSNNIFSDIAIGLLHGQLSPKEKDHIMQKFADGKIKILVSTTVIEVGINVPNASLMIVENAERFGMSQLHQLRGRVGRGTRKSYCILVSEGKGELARRRLETIRTTQDGYAIAEKDLELRGPGDFFSTISGNNLRQSGGLPLRLAKLCTDSSLLFSAFEDANALSKEDPLLIHPEHIALAKEVDRLFDLNELTIS